MKVFISWSGKRSQELAQVLRDWLPLVLHYVQPWLSEADIAAGERWAEEMAKELETTNFGLLCVTRENVGSPWLLFEAGSLAKSLQGSRVIPLLLDLDFSDISGPLAQFQAKKVDRTGLSEAVASINKVAPERISDSRASQLFEALWPQAEKRLALLPKQAGDVKPIRSPQEILEELVATVRSLESRIGESDDRALELSIEDEASELLRDCVRDAITETLRALLAARTHLAKDRKINAIKAVREVTGLGLAEAKDPSRHGKSSWQIAPIRLVNRRPRRVPRTQLKVGGSGCTRS